MRVPAEAQQPQCILPQSLIDSLYLQCEKYSRKMDNTCRIINYNKFNTIASYTDKNEARQRHDPPNVQLRDCEHDLRDPVGCATASAMSPQQCTPSDLLDLRDLAATARVVQHAALAQLDTSALRARALHARERTACGDGARGARCLARAPHTSPTQHYTPASAAQLLQHVDNPRESADTRAQLAAMARVVQHAALAQLDASALRTRAPRKIAQRWRAWCTQPPERGGDRASGVGRSHACTVCAIVESARARRGLSRRRMKITRGAHRGGGRRARWGPSRRRREITREHRTLESAQRWRRDVCKGGATCARAGLCDGAMCARAGRRMQGRGYEQQIAGVSSARRNECVCGGRWAAGVARGGRDMGANGGPGGDRRAGSGRGPK
ncbi:hypothetical protein GGX14DRAFT_664817 [Mycena pura]|uniref:Uncharacterized protein n=1 Tax=Mycena pura TaxID=153505 RepID=A0AAD6UZD1_9AGAR|nr:hypothetical protein GGX14DRAFT_664817 [Mycena pura]